MSDCGVCVCVCVCVSTQLVIFICIFIFIFILPFALNFREKITSVVIMRSFVLWWERVRNELNSTVEKSKIPSLFIKQLLQLQRELATRCAVWNRKSMYNVTNTSLATNNYFNLIRDESSVLQCLLKGFYF